MRPKAEVSAEISDTKAGTSRTHIQTCEPAALQKLAQPDPVAYYPSRYVDECIGVTHRSVACTSLFTLFLCLSMDRQNRENQS